jgi:hypothetical protein
MKLNTIRLYKAIRFTPGDMKWSLLGLAIIGISFPFYFIMCLALMTELFILGLIFAVVLIVLIGMFVMLVIINLILDRKTKSSEKRYPGSTAPVFDGSGASLDSSGL